MLFQFTLLPLCCPHHPPSPSKKIRHVVLFSFFYLDDVKPNEIIYFVRKWNARLPSLYGGVFA